MCASAPASWYRSTAGTPTPADSQNRISMTRPGRSQAHGACSFVKGEIPLKQEVALGASVRRATGVVSKPIARGAISDLGRSEGIKSVSASVFDASSHRTKKNGSRPARRKPSIIDAGRGYRTADPTSHPDYRQRPETAKADFRRFPFVPSGRFKRSACENRANTPWGGGCACLLPIVPTMIAA